ETIDFTTAGEVVTPPPAPTLEAEAAPESFEPLEGIEIDLTVGEPEPVSSAAAPVVEAVEPELSDGNQNEPWVEPTTGPMDFHSPAAELAPAASVDAASVPPAPAAPATRLPILSAGLMD